MARKTPSRMELRRQAEAAETQGNDAPPKRKKATRKKAAPRKSRAKEKTVQRKRLMWGVFSGSMKEEARFPYDQREAAEQKVEQLRSKSKKLYFIQPIKEVVADAPPPKEDE